MPPSHHSNAFLLIAWPYGLSPQLLALLLQLANPRLDIKPIIFLSLLLMGLFIILKKITRTMWWDATYKFVTSNQFCFGMYVSLVCSLCSSSVFPPALSLFSLSADPPVFSFTEWNLSGHMSSFSLYPSHTNLHTSVGILPPLLPFQRL